MRADSPTEGKAMLRYLLLICLLATLAVPATAKPLRSPPPAVTNLAGSLQEMRFNTAERHIIRSGLLQHAARKSSTAQPGLPPGLAKKNSRGKELPQGWQKKVVPGKRLDFEVFRSGRTLPTEILKRLPSPLAGTEIIRVDDTILRVQTETRTVLDMFELFRN
jgi:hypothetical protein